MRITPKDWSKFQHYKDRSPPWIRLHRSLLDNFDFQRLPVASRALAPMLWLLASESDDATINGDAEWLAFRLRMSADEALDALKPLIDNGFFEVLDAPAITPLAPRKRSATPETETETEQRQRKRQRQILSPGASPPAARPEKPTAETWASYRGAYLDRYGCEPVRNAKVNGQLAQLVARLGADESPPVARYYVGLQRQDYVKAMHAVDFLLRDAEGLRTAWATGRQVTITQAMLADRTQTNLSAFGGMLAEARAKEAAHGT